MNFSKDNVIIPTKTPDLFLSDEESALVFIKRTEGLPLTDDFPLLVMKFIDVCIKACKYFLCGIRFYRPTYQEKAEFHCSRQN